jgi:membrane-bound ClpP family serine protease
LKEEEETRKRRHQYQYLGITIGIAVLFVLLVMLGTFKVSAGTIRIVGFFTFLMLFEFIFLLSKKNFYAFTHGEPWKDLAVMIALAALLLPLHHWIEHKVIHYLTSKQLIKIDTSKYLIGRLFSKKQPAKEANDWLQ